MENHSLTVKQIRRMVSGSLRKAGIARGVLVLAAISGGRDSVVLLDALCAVRDKLGFDLAAAHVDHGIRPESAADADFVEELCASHNVPFYCKRVDVPNKQCSGESPEEAARRLRYEALRDLAETCGAACILTAHHADDQKETVLMGLLRGSHGMLCGMREVTTDARGVIVRPLLQASHDDILRYAEALQLRHVEDATNADTAYLRNRLRHDVIPAIERSMGQSMEQSLQQIAASLQRDEDFLQSMADDLLKESVEQTADGMFLKASLSDCHEALRIRVVQNVLRQMGRSCSYRNQEAIADLFSKQVGKSIDLGVNFQALRIKDGVLLCEKSEAQDAVIALNMSGDTVTPWGVFRVSEAQIPNDLHTEPNCQWIGADQFTSLYVRLAQQGEKMQPMGMQNTKLVSDILCDAGVDFFTRSKTPVIANENGILWIVGCRCSEQLRLKAEQKAYLLEFKAILKE